MALRRSTPADARFLTADHHNQPQVPISSPAAASCWGTAAGCRTCGLDTSRVLADVKAIYRGNPPAPALLARYGVDYVVIGPGERKAFTVTSPGSPAATHCCWRAQYPGLLSCAG